MDRRRVAAAIVVVVAGLLVLWLWPSEGARVRRKVEAAGRALEGESVRDLAGCLARDYADESGRSFEEILVAAKVVFDRFDAISIHFLAIDVSVNGPRATARVKVRARGTDRGGEASLFSDEDELEFVVGLKQQGGGWLIYKVDEVSP